VEFLFLEISFIVWSDFVEEVPNASDLATKFIWIVHLVGKVVGLMNLSFFSK